MANPTTGFYSEAKRLTHPRTTLQQFIEKHKLTAEIVEFLVNREFPNRTGNHYVCHIRNGQGSATGVWMTVPNEVEPTLTNCLAALRRECRWVISSPGVMLLGAHLIQLGLVTEEESIAVAGLMRDNVSGFRWAFGDKVADELVRGVVA